MDRSTRKREPWARVLTSTERVLALIGIVCVGAYALACAQGSWFQWRESAAFDQALHARIHAEAHDTTSWSSARVEHFELVAGEPVQALARLEIPDASVSVMVLPGTDERTLDRAVGHVEGTARPGEPGNVAIAGHRDGFFRGLRHLEVGDEMTLTTLEGDVHYEVTGLQVVDPSAVEVLGATEQDTLTLVTCFPFYYVGDAPQRYIVQGRKLRLAERASLRH